MKFKTFRKNKMQTILTLLFAGMFLFSSLETFAKKETPKEEKDLVNSGVVNGLKFRNIGPAFFSGRISDFAVNPNNHSEYYVAVSSGNIWKTENNGITFKPIFDNYGSYSIGCISMDPKN